MQAIIHELSSGVPLPRLDLFGVPPTQTMIEKDIVTEHRPITTLDPSSFVQFEIQSSMDEYIDMEKLYLYLKIKVKKPDTNTSNYFNLIAPINNLLHTMIKQIDIFIGDQQITSSSPTYAYKAYIETLLGFSKEAKKSHLTSQLWYDDEDKKHMDITKTALYTELNKPIKDFKTLDLFGRLHTDLSFQGRNLLGGVKLIIRILFNEPSFYFYAGDKTPTFDFLDCSLQVHRSKVAPMVVEAHNAALQIAPAKYPITMARVKSFTVAQGAIDANIDNIHSGQLPRRVFIAFVENTAFCGDYKKNPFFFNHCGISSLCVYLDGVQYPSKAYAPDFGSKLFMREMHSIYEALDMLDGDSNFNINRDN